MKMDKVILVIVIFAVIEANAHNIARHARSFNEKINKTDKAFDIKESQLSEKESVETIDENNEEARVINISAKGYEAHNLKLERATSDEERDIPEPENDADEINKRRQDILHYLKILLNENRENDDSKVSQTNRRLDVEDNGDDFPGVVDIDDPRSIENHEEEAVDFRANRRTLGYGSMLDMKGRSGEGSPTNTKIYPFYHPVMTRAGLFFNHGLYPSANVPPIMFTKINNGDLLQPLNVPFRENSPRLEIDPRTKANQIQNTYQVDLTLDPNSNAYPFEPEDAKMER